MQYDQDSASVAAQVTSAALQKDPDIVGIFATNLFSAEGAATAVRQSGKQGKVKIVGFDADPDQIKAPQRRHGTGAHRAAPRTTSAPMPSTRRLPPLQGKPTTKKIGTKFTIITKANINASESQAAIYKTSC